MPEAEPSQLKAGAARAVITPPVGYPLVGYPIPRVSKAVLDDLHAQALVLVSAKDTLVLISLDVIAVEKATVDAIRERVRHSTGIPEEHVVVAASHTHTGPPVVDIFDTPANAAYCEWLVDQAAGAVYHAWHRLQPARLAVTRGQVDEICFNRRLLQRRGGLALPTHENYDPSQVTGPEGPTDAEVGIVRVDAEESGRPLALWVNVASHTDTVTGDGISADFPAPMARLLRAVWGSELCILFSQGASGNLIPMDPANEEELASRRIKRYHDVRGREKMERYGLILGGEVVKRAAALRSRADATPLTIRSRSVDLQIRPVSDQERAAACATLSDASASESNKTLAQEVLWVAERARQTESLSIQAIGIGECALVTIPGELFVEHGLAIKRQSPFPHTHIVTLAGGYFGYLPTLEAFANGGYETQPARSSRLERVAGDKLVVAAVELLHELHAVHG